MEGIATLLTLLMLTMLLSVWLAANRNKASLVRVFVDMDGVLAEFRAEKTFEDLYVEGYFANLAPQPLAIKAYKKLMKKYDIYILSCYLTDSPYALKEKKAWVEKYLPGAKCIFVPYGTSKADAILKATGMPIGPNDILIDDHSPNIIDWDAKGGVGIKYLNGINGAGNQWKGRRVEGDFSKVI